MKHWFCSFKIGFAALSAVLSAVALAQDGIAQVSLRTGKVYRQPPYTITRNNGNGSGSNSYGGGGYGVNGGYGFNGGGYGMGGGGPRLY
jgi:hypothetical protein